MLFIQNLVVLVEMDKMLLLSILEITYGILSIEKSSISHWLSNNTHYNILFIFFSNNGILLGYILKKNPTHMCSNYVHMCVCALERGGGGHHFPFKRRFFRIIKVSKNCI